MTPAPYTIREATPDDAEKLIAFMKLIADEPDNGIAFDSAEDFNFTVEQEREFIQNTADADNGVWLVALTSEGELIATVNANGGQRGYYNTLSLGISVAKDWRNRGMGTVLMRHLIDWCKNNPVVHRLHLMVFPNNPRAIHLYEKLGFQHEGVWRSAFKKYGTWLDLIQMAIIFERNEEV